MEYKKRYRRIVVSFKIQVDADVVSEIEFIDYWMANVIYDCMYFQSNIFVYVLAYTCKLYYASNVFKQMRFHLMAVLHWHSLTFTTSIEVFTEKISPDWV